MGPQGNNMHSLASIDDVLARCAVCQAFEKVLHDPVAGTSTVAAFNEKMQVGLLFLDDVIALRVMDEFSEDSDVTPLARRIP